MKTVLHFTKIVCFLCYISLAFLSEFACMYPEALSHILFIYFYYLCLFSLISHLLCLSLYFPSLYVSVYCMSFIVRPFLFVFSCMSVSVCLSVCLYVCVSVYLSICPSIYVFICLSTSFT